MKPIATVSVNERATATGVKAHAHALSESWAAVKVNVWVQVQEDSFAANFTRPNVRASVKRSVWACVLHPNPRRVFECDYAKLFV